MAVTEAGQGAATYAVVPGALLFTSWDAFYVATPAWTCSTQSSASACVPRHTYHPEATACLLHFSVRWKLLQEQRDSGLA